MKFYVMDTDEQDQIDEKTRRTMHKLRANSNPINYMVIYEYHLGRYLGLNIEIDELIEKNGSWSDMLGIRIWEKHIMAHDRMVLSVQHEMQDAAMQVSEISSKLAYSMNDQIELIEKSASMLKEGVVDRNKVIRESERIAAIGAFLKDKQVNFQKILSRFEIRILDLDQQIMSIKKVTYTDILSKLNNRLHMEKVMRRLFNRGFDGKSAAFLTFDIDEFTEFNRLYGHLAGDNMIRLVGELLMSQGEGVMSWRYVDDTFILFLVADSKHTITHKINNMAKKIKELTFTVQEGLRIEGITVSMGATWIVENESWVLALSRANDGLYQARKGGGNRIKIVDFSS